jgi:hypothetical protein
MEIVRALSLTSRVRLRISFLADAVLAFRRLRFRFVDIEPGVSSSRISSQCIIFIPNEG